MFLLTQKNCTIIPHDSEYKTKFDSCNSSHLLENKHAYGPMEDIMDIVNITNKGKMMDMLERFYIYKQTKSNNQINDKLTVKPSTIFETLIHKAPRTGHSDS